MFRTRSFPYTVVDVFTTEPLSGNSLAVFPDASEFDDATMQKIAGELNLTETAFALPATREDCAARLRIFTPLRELQLFAGHPTVGAAFVLLQKGSDRARHGGIFARRTDRRRPDSNRARRTAAHLAVHSSPIHEGRYLDGSLCARALGLEPQDLLPVAPQLLSAGNPTVIVAAKNPSAVDRARLDLAGLRSLKDTENESFCVFMFAPTPEGAYSRMFAPEYGIPEDPATGSSTGPLAAFMMRHGLVSNAAGTRFVSEQGTKMGRRSLLHVEIQGESGTEGIHVGGHVTPVIEAVMTLDVP